MPEHKTFDRRTYMRDYKAKKWSEDPDKMKLINRAFYYKYKFDVSAADMKLYGVLTPEVSQAIHCLDVVAEHRPALLRHIIERYNSV